jgi:hypothetical protein
MSSKAKESPQVQHARKKLKSQLATEEKRVTDAALDRMRESIVSWLDRHADDRVPLVSKVFTVFDENRHPAKVRSKYVYRLLHQLKTQIAKKESLKIFRGRISY